MYIYDQFVTYPAVTPTRIEKPTAKGDRWCSSCSSSVVMRTVRTTRTVRIPSANNPHPASVSFKRVVDPPRLETYIFGGKIACVHKTGIEIKVGWIQSHLRSPRFFGPGRVAWLARMIQSWNNYKRWCTYVYLRVRELRPPYPRGFVLRKATPPDGQTDLRIEPDLLWWPGWSILHCQH